MALSVDAKFRNMEEDVANATMRIYFENNPHPFTGTVVAGAKGEKANESVILTAAHCLKVKGLSVEEVVERLTVRFFKEDRSYNATLCCCIFESEVALLKVARKTPVKYIMDFAPRGGQWTLSPLQPVMAFGHHRGLEYRSDTSEICSYEYKNTLHDKYEKSMTLFDHRLDLGKGCSGAAIINEYKKIVGLHTGIYSDKVDYLDSRPFGVIMKAKEAELEAAFKEKMSTIQPENMAQEKINFDHEMRNLTANFADGNFMRSDMNHLDVPSSGMKIAVHIKYINATLRGVVFGQNYVTPLQQLIEQYYLSGAGSSSGGGSGGARGARG